MSILKKYADRNHYDSTYDDFVGRLERGQIGVAMLRSWDLYGSECVDCEEKVTAFKYRGQRYDLHHSGGFWIIHQCPNLHTLSPVNAGKPEPDYGEADDIAEAQAEAKGEIYPDDPNVRDGGGNIRSGGWFDEYPDDPYNYPDIPYVDPTR